MMKYALICMAIIALIFLFAALMLDATFKKYERRKFKENLNKYKDDQYRL